VAHQGRHPCDELICAALAAGQTVRSTAQGCGVSEQTIWRRLRNPAFKARVEELRRRMVDEATGRLADGLANAIDVMRCLLTSEAEGVALRAAIAHCEQYVRMRDAGDVADQLNELKVLVAELIKARAVPASGGTNGIHSEPAPATTQTNIGDSIGRPSPGIGDLHRGGTDAEGAEGAAWR
jgi:hypothetical protein